MDSWKEYDISSAIPVFSSVVKIEVSWIQDTRMVEKLRNLQLEAKTPNPNQHHPPSNHNSPSGRHTIKQDYYCHWK